MKGKFWKNKRFKRVLFHIEYFYNQIYIHMKLDICIIAADLQG